MRDRSLRRGARPRRRAHHRKSDVIGELVICLVIIFLMILFAVCWWRNHGDDYRQIPQTVDIVVEEPNRRKQVGDRWPPGTSRFLDT